MNPGRIMRKMQMIEPIKMSAIWLYYSHDSTRYATIAFKWLILHVKPREITSVVPAISPAMVFCRELLYEAPSTRQLWTRRPVYPPSTPLEKFL